MRVAITSLALCAALGVAAPVLGGEQDQKPGELVEEATPDEKAAEQQPPAKAAGEAPDDQESEQADKAIRKVR